MKPLLLIAISILVVGCSGKDESTTETKPVEEKNGLNDNITGKAFTLKSPNSDQMARSEERRVGKECER